MKEVKLWRYYFPNEKGEGWAEIVIGSNGFFAAVSDYGNYSFAWRDTGCDDVRKFFLRASSEWDYFAHKLGGEHSEIYDSEATLKGIKTTILEFRRERCWTRDKAREEWDLLDQYENLYSEFDFHQWYLATSLGDAYEYQRRKVRPGLEAFCKLTLKRLSEAIKAELEAEKAA